MKKIRDDFRALHGPAFWVVLFAMCAGFCINCEFSIIKPASNSIFIDHFGSSYIPYAWIAVVPLNFCVVKGYNALISRFGCLTVFFCSTLSVMVLNMATSLYVGKYPAIIFGHYIVKDIYVLLMFQQLWSVIHLTFSVSQAKMYYGIIFGVAGLGAITGSFITRSFAVGWGSEKLLLWTIPLYTIFSAFFYALLRVSSKDGAADMRLSENSAEGGFDLVRNSSYLKYILVIVLCMQMSASILEYQFNSFLELTYPLKDFRTAYVGKLFGTMNLATVTLQFIGSYIMLRVLGVQKGGLSVPILLTVLMLGGALFPTLPMIAGAYGAIKVLDYSLFRIFVEMLYIPLAVHEKFKAKSVIDVFAYRSAKAFTSVLILALGTVVSVNLSEMLHLALLCILVLWIVSVYRLTKSPLFTQSVATA